MQVLVIANVAEGASTGLVEVLVEAEARRVWEMYTGGKVRGAWYRQDRAGAVLLLECVDESEARELVMSLPMVEAGLLSVEVVPLAAYDGIAALFAG